MPPARSCKLDGRARRRVFHGVVQQNGEKLLQSDLVRPDGRERFVRQFQRQIPAALAHRGAPGFPHLQKEGVRLQLFKAKAQDVSILPGQKQQLLGEPLHPLGLRAGDGQQLVPAGRLCGGGPQTAFDDGEWRAQLMAGGDDELVLLVQGRGGGL